MDCNFKRLLWRQQWEMHSQARGAVAGCARCTGRPPDVLPTQCMVWKPWQIPAGALSAVCGLPAGQAGHEPEYTERWGQHSPSAAVECGNRWLPFLTFPPRQTKFWQANSWTDAGRGMGQGAGSSASSSAKSFPFLSYCGQRGRVPPPQHLSLSASCGSLNG